MSEDISSISSCTFYDLTSLYGGAVFFAKTDVTLFFSTSSFYLCSATSYRQSSIRQQNNPAGGSCYIDVKQVNISCIYTSQCSCNYFGDALYISASKTEYSFFNYLSDTLSGKQKSNSYSSIFAIEGCKSHTTNINMTNPKYANNHAAMHIGMTPLEAYFAYVNMIFNDETNQVAIGLSIESGYTLKSEYCNIINFKASSSYSLLGLFIGTFQISNYSFYNCEGNFAKTYNGVVTAFFYDLYVGSDKVTGLNTYTIISTVDSEPELKFEDFHCELKSSLKYVCAKVAFSQQHIPKFLFTSFIHSYSAQ